MRKGKTRLCHRQRSLLSVFTSPYTAYKKKRSDYPFEVNRPLMAGFILQPMHIREKKLYPKRHDRRGKHRLIVVCLAEAHQNGSYLLACCYALRVKDDGATAFCTRNKSLGVCPCESILCP